ncbi:MAG: transaldolase [bacterium]|nr:transaldolase [Gammaproteobacteria bacterium]HIL95453.1 transaldolase [Pseudomonadales bacterium]
MNNNTLNQLKSMTDVVADTGDIEAIENYKPMDATTNPSLLLKAAQLPKYQHLVDDARQFASQQGGSDAEQVACSSEQLAVSIGCQILEIIPGRVSTEVDSRLSFDRTETIARARRIIELYERSGISPERVLIKIASTWEGIQAARVLEKGGINCNLTLLFGFSQAAACADAGVFLVSPFVGRILDWHKANADSDAEREYVAEEDPGVISVTRIYNFYKQHGYDTVVMGASFRNSGEILALAGCDRLTISPPLLEELSNSTTELKRKLSPENPGEAIAKVEVSEGAFRWGMNEDAMATEKLAEGIRNFTVDQIKLEKLLST